jgi:hypothetical protein
MPAFDPASNDARVKKNVTEGGVKWIEETIR